MDPRLELVIAQVRGDFDRARQLHGEWYGEYAVKLFVKDGEIDGASVNGRRMKFAKETPKRVDRRR